MGFDAEAPTIVAWLVRHHLLLADTATRRDLGDERTITRFAAARGDRETPDLLYLLTIGDSLRHRPAAWNTSKAALVRELFVKTRHLLEQGEILDGVAIRRRVALRDVLGAEDADRYLDAFPAAYPLAFDEATMAWHHTLFAPGAVRVEVTAEADGRSVVTVAASDRPGMFAGVTAALALHGLDVLDASAFTRLDGAALESFRVADPFRRLADDAGRSAVTSEVRRALDGTHACADLDGRVRSGRPATPASSGASRRRSRPWSSSTPTGRTSPPSWRCTPTTPSASSAASRPRSASTTSTCAGPRWPPSAIASSTPSRCAP